MSYVTALVQLPLVRETGKEQITSPEAVARICADMSELAQEMFHVLMLNSKNRLIERVPITIGLVDATLIHPREVFRPAIEYGATGIILVHNHPSGDTQPSAEDMKITRQLIAAGKIVGIAVMDHVIIGEKNSFLSMNKIRIVQF